MMMERMRNNIDIEEEKSIKNTLLYVRNLDINAESYETKILLEENIENLMKFRIIFEREKRTLLFDVSNTLSLEEYLKSKRLRKNDICEIVDSIDSILSSVENYLISENSISLDLKLIRITREPRNKMGLKFVALPNLNSNFSYELSKFLIKILRFVDVEDKDAITLAYGLFVRSSKDNYTLSDLMELVDAVRDHNVESLKEYDLEALNAYDEEIAKEISEEELEAENVSMVEYDELEDTNNDNVNEIKMDENTKNIINEELFDDFDEPKAKKVIKFKNKLFDFKPKKALSGHISIVFVNYVMPPVLILVIPALLFFMYGNEWFAKFSPAILVYEVAIMAIFVIRLLKK